VGERIDLRGIDQVLWPDHCVRGTSGSELVADIERARIEAVFPKGEDPEVDSYSGFFDNARRHDTGLNHWLRERGVREVFLVGLATDYCVAATALDAASLGYRTTVLEDGCRGVELASGDVARALSRLRDAGVAIRRSGSEPNGVPFSR
jgi:nicotinamidase/pyrazinamidase